MKKVGETTRPFRYDLNQIPYNYTVEVTNRFKGLDLIGRMPEELYRKDLHDPDNHDGVITHVDQTSWSVKSSKPQEASL